MNNNCPHCGTRFIYQGFSGGECATKGCSNYKPQIITAKAKPITIPTTTYKHDPSHELWEQRYEYKQDVSGLLWYTNCDDPRTKKYWHNNTGTHPSGMSIKECIEYYEATLAPAVLGPPSARGLQITQVQLIGMGMVAIYFRNEQDKLRAGDWFNGWLGSRGYASYKKP